MAEQGLDPAVRAPARPRSAYLDNAKAILITLVVLGHSIGLLALGNPPVTAIYQLIYTFHIPAFVFVSGFLSKPDVLTRKGARGLAALLWAYLLANLLNLVWFGYLEGTGFSPLNVLIRPQYTLWFLLALVWWRALLPAFALGKSRSAALLSIAIALAIAIGSGYLITDGGWMSIARVFVFLPFFVAGYRAKEQGWTVPHNAWTRALAVLAFAAVFYALFALRVIRDMSVLMHSKSFAQLGKMTVAAGVTKLELLVVSAVMVAAFLQLVPRRKLAFTALGATTLSVYIWHAFTLRNIRYFGLDSVLLGSWPMLILTVLAIVVVFGFGPVPKFTYRVTGLGSTARKVPQDPS